MTGVSVAHVVAGLHPKSGGPSRTVIGLCDALARQSELDITLLCQGRLGEPVVPSSVAAMDCRVAQSNSAIALTCGLPVWRELKRLVQTNSPALIHSHGLWAPVNHWAASAAKRSGIPLVIQPRGMLEPWALNHKALKKKIAMALFQRRDLESAALFIATAAMEYESIRALGLRQPVAVIPNGVQFGPAPLPGNTAVAPVPHRPERLALFLSRVHPKKGILNLLNAWALAAPQGWRLQIAGPDEGGHLAEVMALARKLGIDHAVDYLGELAGDAKTQAYLGADLFVLPTFSENFGVVVAEALAHGLPVITTRGAPWADLETFGCGWWVDIGVDPLVHALREAMALRDDERRAMGERGRAYVRRYDWDDIARQTIGVYRWVLGQGPQPDCVRTD